MSERMLKAVKSLFEDQACQVTNVKFFLGKKRDVTAEELADQLSRADAQIRAGLAVPTDSIDGELISRAN